MGNRSRGPRVGGAVAPRVPTVLVLNQYALPLERGGGTRHVELFGRLPGWRPVIIAGDVDHASRSRFSTHDARFLLVRTPTYATNGARRIVGWFVYSSKAFWRGLRVADVRLVYGSSPSLLAPVAAWLLARLRRVPFVLEVRDLWPESIVAAGLIRERGVLHRLLARLERWLVRRADSVVIVTPGWRQHFLELGADADHVVLVPNGSDPDAFRVDEDRETLRSQFGLTRPTAVFAGSHGQKDGIDHILEAARRVPEVDVLLVGDGPVKEQARRHAQTHGITNVRFLDPVPKIELPRLLAACDIGIHAVSDLPVFRQGMSPNKLFDYLAAGLPVVSNIEAGLCGIIEDGECGYLGGIDDLPDRLRRTALASPEQRRRWSERGRSVIEERFSRDVAAARLLQLLDAADAARKGR